MFWWLGLAIIYKFNCIFIAILSKIEFLIYDFLASVIIFNMSPALHNTVVLHDFFSCSGLLPANVGFQAGIWRRWKGLCGKKVSLRYLICIVFNPFSHFLLTPSILQPHVVSFFVSDRFIICILKKKSLFCSKDFIIHCLYHQQSCELCHYHSHHVIILIYPAQDTNIKSKQHF